MIKVKDFDKIKQICKDNNYELLDIVKDKKRSKIIVKCEKGHITSKRLDCFKAGKGVNCLECLNESKRLDIDKVKNDLISFGYTPIDLSNYKNSRNSKIKVKCKEGHIIESSYDNLKVRGCKKCRDLNLMTKEEEIEAYLKEIGIELKEIIEYKGFSSVIKIVCENGHTYETKYSLIKQGIFRCPECATKYKGEEAISIFLEKNNIPYSRQYKFEDCKIKRCLKFDFYLPTYNMCIEYDGIQHFEPTEHFGGEESFLKTQKRDQTKNNYCKENNITLIRIPYWDFKNIENILTQHLL